MSLSEASVKKLADSLFDPKHYREGALDPTFGSDTPYHDLILAAQDAVAKKRTELQQKYYARFEGKEIPQDYKQKQDAIIEGESEKILSKHKQNFVHANANKFIEDLNMEEEVKGLGGWGLMGSLFGGGMGAIAGMLHHLALSVAMKMEPVKQLMAQAQTWVFSQFSDDKKTWQEAGDVARFERKKHKMQQLGGSEESSASMAQVQEEHVDSILVSLGAEERRVVGYNQEQWSAVQEDLGMNQQQFQAYLERLDRLDGKIDQQFDPVSMRNYLDSDKDGVITAHEAVKKQVNETLSDDDRKGIQQVSAMLAVAGYNAPVQQKEGNGTKLEYVDIQQLPEGSPVLSFANLGADQDIAR